MRVRVLGSAAGGGFPQWNCHCGTCEAAREGVRARPRTQSSLAIRGDEGPWFLVNASPDARQQLETLTPDHVDAVRAPPVAGVLLTDAEIDHTAGLLLLRESGAPVRVFGAAAVEQRPRRHDRAHARALLRRRLADAGAGARAADRRVEPRRRAVRDRRRRGQRARGPRQRERRRAHLRARARRARRRRPGPLRRERPRARRRDLLARRRARPARHLRPQRARHGPRPALGPRRHAGGARRADAARARCSSTSTTRTRSCSRTRPSARRSSERASKSPTMASRSTSVEPKTRRVRRPPARAGNALPQPAPVPPADGRRRAHARGAAALGRQPLLLPEVHPAEGRGDPVELPRGRGPARVDPAHHRPRRHGDGHGRHRVVAAARRGARRLARRAGVGAAGPARGALRGRRLRELRALASRGSRRSRRR